MSTQPSIVLSPVQRLTAEGRLLAGFLTEEIALTLPEFLSAPEATQELIRKKFAAANNLIDALPSPVFRHIEEQEVITILAGIAHECSGSASLGNLVGFEWVEINSILAGHYLAAPMPLAARCPDQSSPAAEIAKFCLFGSQISMQDLLMLPSGIITPEKFRLNIQQMEFGPQRLTVEYVINRQPSPIILLLVENRLITVSHQERLIALMEAGVESALCLVQYGYNSDRLGYLPTINEALLMSTRPPCISDFIDPQMTVRLPVPTPKTLVKLSHEIIDLNLR
jgi:hypothetical protein